VAETMTIRVDPSVHGAVKGRLQTNFDWTTSDVPPPSCGLGCLT